MKKIFILAIVCISVSAIQAQKKFTEKTGQEILKLFPAKMKDKNARKENDKVKDAKGFMGVIVHRDYGNDKQKVRVEAINYSPSLTSVNAFLNNPINDPSKYQIVAINGYKAVIQTLYGESSEVSYELLMPLTATLLTIKTSGYTRDDLIALANTIPIAQIAKMVAK